MLLILKLVNEKYLDAREVLE